MRLASAAAVVTEHLMEDVCLELDADYIFSTFSVVSDLPFSMTFCNSTSITILLCLGIHEGTEYSRSRNQKITCNLHGPVPASNFSAKA